MLAAAAWVVVTMEGKALAAAARAAQDHGVDAGVRGSLGAAGVSLPARRARAHERGAADAGASRTWC